MIENHIKQKLEEILSKLGVSYSEIKTSESELGKYRKFEIISDETSILIGRDGANLHALSFITRKVVEPFISEHDPEYRFYIDVGDYEALRIGRIQQTARMFADRALMFERDVELPPMDAYDRMIVHTTIDGYENLETESSGEKNFRKVVVRYKTTL